MSQKSRLNPLQTAQFYSESFTKLPKQIVRGFWLTHCRHINSARSEIKLPAVHPCGKVIGARGGDTQNNIVKISFTYKNTTTLSSPDNKEKTSNFAKYYDTHIKALL